MFNLHLFKSLVFACILVISLPLLAQEEYNAEEKIACEKAKQLAQLKFNKGEMTLTSYGLIAHTDWDFQEFYTNYIHNTYGITIKNGGCVIISEDLCFEDEMRRLIKSKLGDDVLLKAKEEARVLYKKSK